MKDERIDQLILLHQQVTAADPSDEGYPDLLERTRLLALELYLDYQASFLLRIGEGDGLPSGNSQASEADAGG